MQYSAITDLHTFQFTTAHVLGFSVSTSHFLATDLSTETVTQITTSITPKIFQLHFQFHCTIAYIKSSIPTVGSSSTMNILRLSHTCLERPAFTPAVSLVPLLLCLVWPLSCNLQKDTGQMSRSTVLLCHPNINDVIAAHCIAYEPHQHMSVTPPPLVQYDVIAYERKSVYWASFRNELHNLVPLLRNLATNCWSRVCLQGNLFNISFLSNRFTCHNIIKS
jgi:hypothetical protein